jgi:hypothetical protein
MAMEQTLKYNRATRNFVRYEAAFSDGNISGSLYIPLSELSEPYPQEITVRVVVQPSATAPAKKVGPAKKVAPPQKAAARPRRPVK